MPVTTATTAAQSTSARTRGRVEWFSPKGFGFIVADDGTDVYVHHSAIVGTGFRTLPTDARVTFRIHPDARGPEARDVRVEGDEPSTP